MKYFALDNSWTAHEVLPWTELGVLFWAALEKWPIMPWTALEVLTLTYLEKNVTKHLQHVIYKKLLLYLVFVNVVDIFLSRHLKF